VKKENQQDLSTCDA